MRFPPILVVSFALIECVLACPQRLIGAHVKCMCRSRIDNFHQAVPRMIHWRQRALDCLSCARAGMFLAKPFAERRTGRAVNRHRNG